MTGFVAAHGLYAVFGLMAIDAVLPVASELVLLVGGALATSAFATHVSLFGTQLDKGAETFIAVSVAGTIGYLLGSLAGWAIGRYGGRPLIERHPRLFHLSPEKFDRAEKWFDRWGAIGVFVGRLTPLVRSFVSVAAGILEMPFWAYTAITLLASAIWTFAVAGLGWGAGSAYTSVHHDARYVEYAVVAVIASAAVVWFIRRNIETDQHM